MAWPLIYKQYLCTNYGIEICVYIHLLLFFFCSSATSEKKVQIKSQNPREKIWQRIKCGIIKFVFRSSSSYSECFVIYNIRNKLDSELWISGCSFLYYYYYSGKKRKYVSRFHILKKSPIFDCLHYVLACDDISLQITFFFHFVTLWSQFKKKVSIFFSVLEK